jgi:U2 small nuclear ribonucleoprotein B''
MFSQFGKILDVVCLKTYRLRGQAWVVFSDVASATNALRSMQGFPFFDKPIVRSHHRHAPACWKLSCMACLQKVEYAKTKSDAVAKLEGSYKPDKKERSQKNAAVRGTSRAVGVRLWAHAT